MTFAAGSTLASQANAQELRFTVDEVKQLNTELARIEVKGERLSQMVLAFSNVEAPVKK